MKLIGNLIILTLSIELSSCAWLFSSNNSDTRHTITTNSHQLPHVPAVHIPMGLTNNWHYLATSSDNNIISEIDTNSIKQITPNIYQFIERKTIKSMSKLPDNISTNGYKYVINSWQMNCESLSYKLTTSDSYDKLGNKIVNLSLANALNNTWISIPKQSIAYAQYKYICLHVNQDLGY